MKNTISKIFLLLIFFVSLLPLWWMLVGSFMDIFGVLTMPPKFFPINPTLDNYKYLLKNNFSIFLVNTLLVTSIVTISSVITSVMAGFFFAFVSFKFKSVLWIILLSSMMYPRISLIISQYVIIGKLGISGTLAAAILPCIFTPVGMYLSRNYFQTIPISIIESARMDGASDWKIIRKIIIPISSPLIMTLGVFASVGSLQDYIWQMLVLQREDRQTLLVGIMRLIMKRGGMAELGVNPIGRALAGGVILLIPILIIFFIANKYFVSSLSGSVKE